MQFCCRDLLRGRGGWRRGRREPYPSPAPSPPDAKEGLHPGTKHHKPAQRTKGEREAAAPAASPAAATTETEARTCPGAGAKAGGGEVAGRTKRGGKGWKWRFVVVVGIDRQRCFSVALPPRRSQERHSGEAGAGGRKRLWSLLLRTYFGRRPGVLREEGGGRGGRGRGGERRRRSSKSTGKYHTLVPTGAGDK